MVILQRENGHVTEVVSLGRENGHVPVVVSLWEGEWSFYRGGQFNGGEWSVQNVKEVATLKENGCYSGGQRENNHVTEVASLMEGEWSL